MDKISLFQKEGKHEKGSLAVTLLVIALFLAFNLILVAVGSKWALYAEMRDRQFYTLRGVTDEYFEAINPENKEVKFYFCMSEDELGENNTYARILDTVRQFDERYDFFSVSYLDVYYDYKTIAEFAEKNDTDVAKSAVILHCPATGNSIVRALSTFYIYDTEDETNDDMIFNGEEIVATLVSRVLEAERPTACFTTGHGELSTAAMQNLLYSAGYDIITEDISRKEIDESCKLIVISAPLYDFEEYADKTLKSEISRLREFISRGGTVWVLRSASSESLPRLDAFLAEYGLSADGGALLRDSEQSLGSSSASVLLQYADAAAADAISSRADIAKEGAVVFRESTALTLTAGEGYTVSPILKTHESARLYRAGEQISKAPDGGYTVLAMSEVLTKDGENGHVLLSGTSLLAEGSSLDMSGYGNEALLYSLIEYTDGMKTPIGCGTVTLNTYPLSGISRGTADLYFWLLAIGVPLVCAAAGAFTVLKRKHR